MKKKQIQLLSDAFKMSRRDVHKTILRGMKETQSTTHSETASDPKKRSTRQFDAFCAGLPERNKADS